MAPSSVGSELQSRVIEPRNGLYRWSLRGRKNVGSTEASLRSGAEVRPGSDESRAEQYRVSREAGRASCFLGNNRKGLVRFCGGPRPAVGSDGPIPERARATLRLSIASPDCSATLVEWIHRGLRRHTVAFPIRPVLVQISARRLAQGSHLRCWSIRSFAERPAPETHGVGDSGGFRHKSAYST